MSDKDGNGGMSWITNVRVTCPSVAVNVMDWVEETGLTVTLNCWLVAPAGTSDAGPTTIAALFDANATRNPGEIAGTLTVIVQRSVPDPDIDAFAQEKPVSSGPPLPFMASTALAFVLLFATVSCPVVAASTVGANETVTTADSPGLRVIGNPEEAAKFVPATDTLLKTSGAVPDEVTVTDRVAVVPTGTVPKATLDTLKVRAGEGGLS